MTRKKNIYSPEFKTQAISLVREAKRPAAEVARELGINTNTLYNWLSSVSCSLPKKVANNESADEIKRLKKALVQAEMERDILKKAAAYFAKETL
jgi:transposase